MNLDFLAFLGLALTILGALALGWVAGARDLRDARDQLVLARYDAAVQGGNAHWLAGELREALDERDAARVERDRATASRDAERAARRVVEGECVRLAGERDRAVSARGFAGLVGRGGGGEPGRN